MVQLNETYAVEDVVTRGKDSHVPDGTYMVVIIDTYMEDSFMEGKPQDLMVKCVIVEGEHKDTEIIDRLSIFDETAIKPEKPTWTWKRAAFSKLGSISSVLGMERTPSDTNQLHNKPLMITTKTRKGKDKDTGEHKPEWDSSFIEKYKAVPSVGVSSQPQSAVAKTTSNSGSNEIPWR